MQSSSKILPKFHSLETVYTWLENTEPDILEEHILRGEININKLPTFGGTLPQENINYISYDEKSLLILYYTCDMEARYVIIPRKD